MDFAGFLPNVKE